MNIHYITVICIVSTLLVLLVDYFKRFSSKNCCYDDMKSYLSLLNEDGKKEVCNISVNIAHSTFSISISALIKTGTVCEREPGQC